MNTPDDLPDLPDIALGHYRHYKGGDYEVIGMARHSESLEPMVVYRPLYNATGMWVRPHAMFVGTIELDGQVVLRFQRIENQCLHSICRPISKTSPHSDIKPSACT